MLSVELRAPPGPKYARLEQLGGRRIEAVGRRGKYLILPLSDLVKPEGPRGRADRELIIHLGMTGVITGTPPRGKAEGHVRVSLGLDGPAPACLYFIDPRRFGRFLVVASGEYEGLPTLAALGPEPLDDSFTPERFHVALTRSMMPVKAYLLSQRPVAGVGNIYADEALWRARVNPATPAAKVGATKAAALRDAIRDVLTASLAAHGTTLSDYRTVGGEAGSFAEYLDVYGHAGEACRRCGAQLRRVVVGQRGTVYCPRCQPDTSTASRAPTAGKRTVARERRR